MSEIDDAEVIECPGCETPLEISTEIEQAGSLECPDCGKTSRAEMLIPPGGRATPTALLVLAIFPTLGLTSGDPTNPSLLSITACAFCLIGAFAATSRRRSKRYVTFTKIALAMSMLLFIVGIFNSLSSGAIVGVLLLGGLSLAFIGFAFFVQQSNLKRGIRWVIDPSSD